MKAPLSRIRSPLFRLALAAGVFAGLLASTGPAMARSARIAVLPFQGPSGNRLRGAVVNGLGNEVEVVSLAEIRRAAASVTRPMGPSALWQVVSRRLNLSAVIKGQVTGGRRWQARLIVNHAGTGVSVGSVVISDRRSADLFREVARTAPPRLMALVRKTAGGAPVARAGSRRPMGAAGRQTTGAGRDLDSPSSADLADGSLRPRAAGDDDEEDGSLAASEAPEISVSPGKASPPPMLEASIGPRAIFRSLTFSDNYAAVPGYRLPGAPGVAAEATFYPGVRMTGWMSQVGLAGAFESSVGATSQGQPGTNPSPTRHLSYRVGARGRVPLPVVTVLLGADYGEQHFALQVPSNVMSPESHYGFFRPSIGGRVAFNRMSFVLSAGYLQILDAAGLTAPAMFPKATIRGGDVGAMVGYAFDRGLQVQVGADYRRYAYTMNVQEGDALVVGGALDEYFGLTALLTYRFR
jgi:TolB-like protein